MKRIIGLLTGTAVAALLTGAAQAADLDYQSPAEASGFYIRGDIGYSFLEWDGPSDDGALTAGGGIGYRFNDFLRADIRYTYAGRFQASPWHKLETHSVLGNVYFDLPVDDWPFRPYVGAGLGWGKGICCNGADDEDGLAAAFMAGVTFALTDNLDLDIGYKFQDIFISGPNITEHQITAGFRYNF